MVRFLSLYIFFVIFLVSCQNSNRGKESQIEVPETLSEINKPDEILSQEIVSIEENEGIESEIEEGRLRINFDSLRQLFLGADLECYDLPNISSELNNILNSNIYIFDLVEVELANDTIIEFFLGGFLIKFSQINEDVYCSIFVGEGENIIQAKIVTYGKDLEEIDSSILSLTGGDEEDIYEMSGCFISENEYIASYRTERPIQHEYTYVEEQLKSRILIKPDGEIDEIVLESNTDTFSLELPHGKYQFGEDNSFEIHESKQITIFYKDEKSNNIDSLSGFYTYDSRYLETQFHIHVPIKDEYGNNKFDYRVDMRWS